MKSNDMTNYPQQSASRLAAIILTLLFLLITSKQIHAQRSYIKLDLNVDSVKINIDNDFENIRYYQNGDSIALSPGQHYFVLTWPLDEPAEYYRTLSAGNTTVLMHRFDTSGQITNKTLNRNYAARDYFGSNLMLQTDPDSEIWYRGQKVGEGFLKLNAARGLQQFEIRNPDFGNRRIEITNNANRVTYGSVYARPEKKFTLIFSPIPGASQLIKRQKKKAFVLFGSAVLTGGLLGLSNHLYKNELSELRDIRGRYRAASTIEDAERLGVQLDEQQDVVNRNELYRNLSLIPIAAVLTWNIYDAFFSEPNGGYRKSIPIRTYLEREPITGKLYPSIHLRVSR